MASLDDTVNAHFFSVWLAGNYREKNRNSGSCLLIKRADLFIFLVFFFFNFMFLVSEVYSGLMKIGLFEQYSACPFNPCLVAGEI